MLSTVLSENLKVFRHSLSMLTLFTSHVSFRKTGSSQTVNSVGDIVLPSHTLFFVLLERVWYVVLTYKRSAVDVDVSERVCVQRINTLSFRVSITRLVSTESKAFL